MTFKHQPKRAFWASGRPVPYHHPDKRRFPHGIPIKAELDGSAARLRDRPAKAVVGLRQLDFGNTTAPTAMTIMKSLMASSNLGDMEMELNIETRQLAVYFALAAPTVHAGSRQFRFEVDLSQARKVYQTVLDDGSIAWVLHLARPPKYFWRMDDVEATFTPDARTWGPRDVWYRATNVAQDLDTPMRYPVAVHNEIKDPDYAEIGCWTTFRLVVADKFRRRPESRALSQLRKGLEELNVSVEYCDAFSFPRGGETMWDYLDHPPLTDKGHGSALLAMAAPPIIHLPFPVRYQLEVCVSRGMLNENSITADFLHRLAALRPFDATRRLEYLADQNEPLYDPLQLFADSDAESYVPNTKIPHYCTLIRKAIITPTAIRYNSPAVEASNRVVRKYNHLQDRFLRVQFVEEAEQGRIAFNYRNNDEIFRRMLRVLFNGIRIGDRLYEFLGFGNSQLRECGAYFFCPTEHTSCDDIRGWMGNFSHIRVVAKYAARLGQCFSSTREIRGIFTPKTRRIPDVERNGFVFTDGVGIISPFLARLVIQEMALDVLDEPTAFQFRMGGCKGVLAVWPQAKGMEVLVRDSQKKFTAVFNGLEIIKCAKYSTATLNRQTIPILECLGVPKSAFVALLDHQIREYESAMKDNSVAVSLLTKFVDENQSTLILAELLKAGFRSDSVQEPFTVNLMNLWRSWTLKLLKEKARINIDKSAFVLGCVDETHTLRGHSKATEGSSDNDVNKLPQIFLQLTDPARCDQTIIIKGLCAIGRNPSLHPGDIRVVQAVDNPKLRHLKDVVVFPSKGDRPVPSMLAGGDLDGDDYFVIWDPNLIPREWNYSPMEYSAPKPKKISRDVNIDDVRDFFVEYMKSDVLGQIAHAHVAYADSQGPKSQRCVQLAGLHSEAVDFPKTGKPAEIGSKLQPERWPHFMEKRRWYESKRALGVIYDKVKSRTVEFRPDWQHAFDQRITTKFELENGQLEAARRIKAQYDLAVRRILAQLNVATEFELYTSWAMSKPAVESDYKRQEQLGREFDLLKARHRELCYEAAGGSDPDKLDRFVAAMYRVTEQEMHAALREHEERAGDGSGGTAAPMPVDARSMPLISFPWIFHWVLIRIATGSKYKPKESLFAAAERAAQSAAGSLAARSLSALSAEGSAGGGSSEENGAAAGTTSLWAEAAPTPALVPVPAPAPASAAAAAASPAPPASTNMDYGGSRDTDGWLSEQARDISEPVLMGDEEDEGISSDSEAETLVGEEEPVNGSAMDRLAALMDFGEDEV
ncbi:hypothetical protein CDD83_8988 [Cordyceps sp. RAO-2017]|nr:hypothetical protein CDD83_8988 [Cordyceps sp. RAO-2017]